MALTLTHNQAMRFVQKLTPNGQGCWIWTGHTTHDGYGQVCVGHMRKMAHRVPYEALYGFVPTGWTLDHTCRNRACCNPRHLEMVTMRENILRGTGLGARNARKTHCPKGHPLQPKGNGIHRFCLTCQREYDRVWKQAARQRKKETKTQRSLVRTVPVQQVKP